MYSQRDAYTGETMTNPTVPTQFKNERRARVVLGRHSIVGANSVVFPGVEMGEGTAVGNAGNREASSMKNGLNVTSSDPVVFDDEDFETVIRGHFHGGRRTTALTIYRLAWKL